ncbi:hypothetical protein SKAU_G00291770 [Synaphobranchus kaupii]|uniref:Uncharacterized protein n=1 Tax=Synaphobranchus kaupii TaxID=118154 RepID=A0A9Q1IM60_SYNKA|nr:hypothetical protein SKAU_G00291770 [Synaphobranchus kaupii]
MNTERSALATWRCALATRVQTALCNTRGPGLRHFGEEDVAETKGLKTMIPTSTDHYPGRRVPVSSEPVPSASEDDTGLCRCCACQSDSSDQTQACGTNCTPSA